jgi:hypothetical protein
MQQFFNMIDSGHSSLPYRAVVVFVVYPLFNRIQSAVLDWRNKNEAMRPNPALGFNT